MGSDPTVYPTLTPPDNDDPLEIMRAASWKYQYDFEFSRRVDRVVQLMAEGFLREIPEGISPHDVAAQRFAIAVTLYLEDG